MEKMIQTHHSNMTIRELRRAVEEGSRPIKRSPHMGNIPPKDLSVMAGLPPGVEVLMVSTIQGDDKITKPYVIRISESEEIQLTSRSAATGRVVGAVAIKFLDERMQTLSVTPKSNQSLADYHAEALQQLDLPNPPIDMMDRFNQHPDLLKATLEACKEDGCLHRKVGQDGKIHCGDTMAIDQDGIYGVLDSTPTSEGVLLPLNGMMAIDMLLSEREGSTETLHLGGDDMVRYTQDEERMKAVSRVKARAASLLGQCSLQHHYVVQGCSGLAVLTPEVSQHALLLSGRSIDPSEHLDKPCGVNDANH